jgi:hypothetical protein
VLLSFPDAAQDESFEVVLPDVAPEAGLRALLYLPQQPQPQGGQGQGAQPGAKWRYRLEGEAPEELGKYAEGFAAVYHHLAPRLELGSHVRARRNAVSVVGGIAQAGGIVYQ